MFSRLRRTPPSARQSLLALLLAFAALGAALVAPGAVSAAAVTATFNQGVLSVNGTADDNNISISRDAAGKLLVNGGAVSVVGGTPTVANTAVIKVFGLAGNDVITLSEVNGALPVAHLFGGVGNDTITGGSGADQLFGESGNDTLLGKGGNDLLFGGNDNDTLTGGDADDQVFGQSGNDRMIWNPGDDTDLNEGGAGSDTIVVNGGNGAEKFSATANGTRVRFDRLEPAPFALDIGTSESLVLLANGGDDNFSATGNLAALIKITVDGGTGNDTLLGSNGIDQLLGGDGDDTVDGQQDNDVVLLGTGDDIFNWDPGDGSDIIEGQDGNDRLSFNGSNISERFDVSANGKRVRFTRDVANIVMDLDGVENLNLAALGGADMFTVNDLSGTALTAIVADIRNAPGGSGDGQADQIIVNGTLRDDVIKVSGSGGALVTGLSARVTITGTEVARDTMVINTLVGDDAVEAADLAAGQIGLTINGGDGNDVLVGSPDADTLLGGAGDDVLVGGRGKDIIDGGAGSNVVIPD